MRWYISYNYITYHFVSRAIPKLKDIDLCILCCNIDEGWASHNEVVNRGCGNSWWIRITDQGIISPLIPQRSTHYLFYSCLCFIHSDIWTCKLNNNSIITIENAVLKNREVWKLKTIKIIIENIIMNIPNMMLPFLHLLSLNYGFIFLKAIFTIPLIYYSFA